MSLLKSLAKKADTGGGKKKKDEKPQIDLPEINKEIEDFIKATKDKKDAEGRQAHAKSLINEKVRPAHLQASRDAGTFEGSIILNKRLLAYVQYRTDTGTVAKGEKEVEETMKKAEKVFGKEDAARFFRQDFSIAFKEGKKTDEIIGQIMEAVGGAEKFQEIFAIDTRLIQTEALFKGRFTDPKIDEKAQKLEDDGILRSYSLSLKEA